VGIVNAAAASAKELAIGGQAPTPAPAQVFFRHILEAQRAEVARLADDTLLDQGFHIAQRGHKAIGEANHVADTGALGSLIQAQGLREVHPQRLLTQDMLARLNRRHSDRVVHLCGVAITTAATAGSASTSR